MSSTAFSTGFDCQVVLIGPKGRVDLSLVTGFSANQTVKTIRVDPLNAPPIEAHLPSGWTGEFMLERNSSAADDFFSNLEQDYWAGRSIGFSTLYQYVQEKDESTSTYQYDQVAIHLSDAGSWKAEGSVSQKITFFASTRKRI